MEKQGKLDRLVVGSNVFYPGHGVAVVAGVEQRSFGEQQQEFYVLELAQGGKVMLPTANVELARVRALIPVTVARALLKTVCQEPELVSSASKEWAARCTEILREGVPEPCAEVLRQLLFRASAHKLGMTDRRLLEMAHANFVNEIGAVLKRSPEHIAAQLPPMDGSPRGGESKA